jgi:tetratricopeptide (TPR) repeat protein
VDVADALTYAHSLGVIHRDIKPENILLSGKHAIVADFGIARALALASAQPLTQTGAPIGTPAYMSPEQIKSSETADGRSDVYSLGCVVYELLAGRPPFHGTTVQALMHQHVNEVVPELDQIRSGLPRTVSQALATALAKLPEDRFDTPADFARALTGSLSPQARSTKRVRWRQLLVVAAAAVTIGVVVTRGFLQQVTETQRRVVVAALENQTGDPSLDPIGSMASHWITEGLQRSGVAEVVPTPTAMQAASFVAIVRDNDPTVDPVRAMADETGAGIVISGVYFRETDAVQFHVQITDAKEAKVLTTLDPVTVPIDSASQALEPIRERVVGFLATYFDERLPRSQNIATSPPTFEAYRVFKEGMERYTSREYSDALPLLREAANLDSSFNAPLVYLAMTHEVLFQFSQVDSVLTRLAERSEQLTDYERHYVDFLRSELDGDLERALRALRSAVEVAPRSRATYNWGATAIRVNRPREALDALLSLDPERGPMRGFFMYWWMLTEAYHLVGEHEKELQAARRARVLLPGHPYGPGLEAEALVALGRLEEVDSLLRNLTLPSHWYWTVGRTWSETAEEFRAHGHDDEAREWFTRSVEWMDARPSEERSSQVHRWLYGWNLFNLGNYDGARQVFESLLHDLPRISGTDDYAQVPTLVHFTGRLGVIAARSGRLEEADSISQVLADMDVPYQRGLQALYRAYIEAALGNRPTAVSLLRQSFDEGQDMGRWFHRDPDLKPLHGYGPFEDLARPKG